MGLRVALYGGHHNGGAVRNLRIIRRHIFLFAGVVLLLDAEQLDECAACAGAVFTGKNGDFSRSCRRRSFLRRKRSRRSAFGRSALRRCSGGFGGRCLGGSGACCAAGASRHSCHGEKCGCKNRGDFSEFHKLLFPFGSFLLAFYLFLWFTSESIGPFCKLKKKSCVKST